VHDGCVHGQHLATENSLSSLHRYSPLPCYAWRLHVPHVPPSPAPRRANERNV
jgi:hypothetical protein